MYLVDATVNRTGLQYPPFLMPAADEQAIRDGCRRNWLTVRSVKVYEGQVEDGGPKLLLWGPPLSDQTFERDYHNRPPDPDTKEGITEAEVVWTGLQIFQRLLGL
jgi:hypothetical protein